MKHKLFTLLIAVMANLGAMFAESGTCGDNLTWNLTDGVLTISGTGAMTNYSSSSNIPWYSSRSSIASVVINDGVTSIGENAFQFCRSLISVSIGNSVTSIGKEAFYGCSGLTSLTIPNNVISIGDGAFNNCMSLASMSIGNSVTSIGNYAFNVCNSLTSLTIPNSVTSIGNYAFDGCSSLVSVTIPNSVTSIGDGAFYNCSTLNSIYYNGSLEEWCNKSWILEIIFETSNMVMTKEYRLYINNILQENITIPNTVTSIGEGTFYCCRSLTSVTIPNSTTSIGAYAFMNCSSLATISLSNTLTHIGLAAFEGCSNLTSVTIPNSLTNIEQEAFAFTGLSSIIIPENVTSIGVGAFLGCESLASVSIPENVAEIGALAFGNCSALTSLEWNAKQCSSNGSLFYYSGYSASDIRKQITSLTIGANVRSLPDSLCANMTNLKTITSYAETPPTLGEGVFTNAYRTPKIYVPCNMKQSYQTEDGWSSFSASCYQYAPSPYQLSLRSSDYSAGTATKVSTGSSCEGHVFQATANTGYHFVQWSDGISDNPRTVLLTQDTTFTAEFAKNTYTISVQANNSTWGTVSDNITAYYQDEVTLTATANYGYHFEYWENNDSRYSYSNPYTFTVQENDVYTANFAKNTYYLNYYYDSSKGSVSGSSSGEYLDEITIQAEPLYGYHFVQWSDGVKDNPRTIELTQDTTFRAEFAVDRAGQCGTNMQLTWVYDSANRILTISGNGSLEYNYTYGVEAPSEMRELVIANGVTALGEDAFRDAETLVELTLGEDVKTIKDDAFKGCINLSKIYNYRATPTNAYSYAFDEHLDKFDCKLYVLAGSVEMYKQANVWKNFYYIEPIGTTETTVTENKVTVSPADNTALFTWQMSKDASTYTLQITRDGVIFCTLVFGADGSLKGIAFAPGRNGQAHASAAMLTANGMQFTVTGLDVASKYAYRLAVADAQNNEIIAYSGEFATNGYEGEVNPGGNPEGIDEVPSDQVQSTKFLRDGQIFILRGEKVYTITGQEVK